MVAGCGSTVKQPTSTTPTTTVASAGSDTSFQGCLKQHGVIEHQPGDPPDSFLYRSNGKLNQVLVTTYKTPEGAQRASQGSLLPHPEAIGRQTVFFFDAIRGKPATGTDVRVCAKKER